MLIRRTKLNTYKLQPNITLPVPQEYKNDDFS